MDDVWGNAWSTASSSSTDNKKSSQSGPAWSTFERDADNDTIDVGISSWNAGSGLGYERTDTNMWHAESSRLDAWDSSVVLQKPEGGQEESNVPHEEEDEDKSLEPRTILPTPPQSPPHASPAPSPTPSPTVEDIPPASRSEAGQSSFANSDPFGSFESAETPGPDVSQPESWATTWPSLSSVDVDEPWSRPTGAKDENDPASGIAKDEWELAEEAKQRQERKVPPELLASLITCWNEYCDDVFLVKESNDTGSQSWRKGLDNVEGLTDLMERIVPATSYSPPPQFSKTAVCKAVKESLRLTRSFVITRSSPMSHLHGSKGSTDWERSVKAQKAAANDEWGWDLKHEFDEKDHTSDSVKGKKGGSLLSFWSKKNAATNESTVIDQPSKSPTLISTSTTPVQTRVENSSKASPSAAVPSALGSLPSPGPSTAASEPVVSDDSAGQPSVVSRLLNKFSRKTTTSEKDMHSPVTLSESDMSIVSGFAPAIPGSTSGALGSTHSSTQDPLDKIGSLDPLTSKGSHSRSSSKLPPVLAPPPNVSASQAASKKATISRPKPDLKRADAPLLSFFDNMGHGSATGYAPVSFDLIDSPEKANPTSPIFPSPTLPSSTAAGFPPSAGFPPTGFGHEKLLQEGSSASHKRNVSHSGLVSISPPVGPVSPTTNVSGILAPRTPSPPVSKRSSQYNNPLPPTPRGNDDDFSEFLSTSTSSTSQRHSLTPGRETLLTGSFSQNDFGDFGDFSARPLRSPPPPNVPTKQAIPPNHKAAEMLVNKAASMSGRWPRPSSPLPPSLPPPPGQGKFVKTLIQTQPDLLSDFSPEPMLGVHGKVDTRSPLISASPSRPSPSVNVVPGFVPRSPPMLTPEPKGTSPVSATTHNHPEKSGLSAQDLSFFEGL